MKKVKEQYENGQCPDCFLDIPETAISEEACDNCGHVFVHVDDVAESTIDPNS